MASQYQHPYLAHGALADYQRSSINTLASAYGPGNTMQACGKKPGCPSTQYCPDKAFASVPCGYNGNVVNCPKNSMMDWWITGWQNSIYAVNGGSLWPNLEDAAGTCGQATNSCYDYAPKLLGCCAGRTGPDQGAMSLPGLNAARRGAGVDISMAYGFNAEAAAAANMGIGNYSRMQKAIPPRALQEPCAGSFLR